MTTGAPGTPRSHHGPRPDAPAPAAPRTRAPYTPAAPAAPSTPATPATPYPPCQPYTPTARSTPSRPHTPSAALHTRATPQTPDAPNASRTPHAPPQWVPPQWGSAPHIPARPDASRAHDRSTPKAAAVPDPATAPGRTAVPDDAEAGPLVRPYTASNGRTRPLVTLDLRARLAVTDTFPPGYLTPEQRQVLALCRAPTRVADITAHLRLPVAVTKVLLGDLLDCGALSVHAPAYYDDPTDRSLLEAVLKGLRRQL